MADVSSQALLKEKEIIVQSLPTRAEIFLPTEKVSLADQVAGLKSVKGLYENRLHQYHLPRLKALKAGMSHKKRCFLIGNGPSLNQTDLSLLKDEVTFAVNGFFLKSKELDWTPTFYLVEDHLVAEDRKEQIIDYKGPVKLFPAYLRYCLPEAEDTIFYNHRPRVSYPHGFDFSLEADTITYAGCTVIFSAMQMAAYLGFEEIYLIGVDADYDIPKDIKLENEYGTSVLDMDSDDINHFHPDYFGKGYRWHDPQVDKMVQAYEEAKRITDAAGFTIYNATVGGKLEVFPRKNYSDLFKITAKTEAQLKLDLPRTLLIDFTKIGGGTATGELKSKYFGNWPISDLFHVYGAGHVSKVAVEHPSMQADTWFDVEKLYEAVNHFNPDIIIYRPVGDHEKLHDLALRLIEKLAKPYLIWMMDDWPARLEEKDPNRAVLMKNDLQQLCQSASECIAISPEMAGAFAARYGATFKVFHNGIFPENWKTVPKKTASKKRLMKVRYAGALADDMTFESISDIVNVVERLGRQDHKISMEILSNPLWSEKVETLLLEKEHVFGVVASLNEQDYRKWLKEADVLIIANNFTPESRNYLKYSFANKIPECLASGAAVLAYGPNDNSTIRYLKNVPGVQVVTDDNVQALSQTMKALLNSPRKRLSHANASRNFALQFLDMSLFVKNFEDVILTASISKVRRPIFEKRRKMKEVSSKESGDSILSRKVRKESGKSDHRLPPVVQAFLRYVLSWKGAVGLISIASLAGAVFIGFMKTSAISIGLAVFLATFSQFLLFGLIAHLAAYINVKR